MLAVILVCIVVGAIAGAVSGYPIIGWFIGIVLFLVGLPGALISLFVHDSISYAQDRADDRQIMADIEADIRAEEHEYCEDRRAAQRKPDITYDNRQIHFHNDEYKKRMEVR